MQIFLMTLKKVFTKADINLSAEVTMPWFDGTN